MSELAAALTRSMQNATTDLVVLDRETSSWQRYPWPEVHGFAERIAAWLLDRGRPQAVGLVGEPTAEFVAAIQGVWLAGAGLSILPARSAAPTTGSGRNRRSPAFRASGCTRC